MSGEGTRVYTSQNGAAAVALGSAVWPAFCRALGRAARADEPDDQCARRDAVLADVRARMEHALSGGAAPWDAPAWPPEAAEILDDIRRCFADELRAEPPADAFGAVRVFSALARFRGGIGTFTPHDVALEGSSALSLAVEVAHDMRSPLAAIMFLGDMLRTGRSGTVSELQRQQLGLIYAAAYGLTQLACDLIDFVREGRDVIDRDPAAFSLSELLCAVGDLLLPVAEEKGITLRTELQANRTHVGSAAGLSRVLLNLATNAIVHTTAGLVTIRVREVTPERLEFAVEDREREIPAHEIAQLFEPYSAARAGTGRAFSSSGLGLAICHRLVAAMGGELRVSTEPGRGTRFWFELDLPAARDDGDGLLPT